jgi:hypothetical protein
MDELVLHHWYRYGEAMDLSDHHNHGTVIDGATGAGDTAAALTFNGISTRVIVSRGSALRSFSGVAGAIDFYLAVDASPARYNLAEGHLSFALYVQADDSLCFTIVDANGMWRGTATGPRRIDRGRWHRVLFAHDGFCTCRLALDGSIVAEAIDVPGPVRGLGPLGLSIGNWPDADRYQLRGAIREIRLYAGNMLTVLEREVAQQKWQEPPAERVTTLTKDGRLPNIEPLVALIGSLSPTERDSLRDGVATIQQVCAEYLHLSSAGDPAQALADRQAVESFVQTLMTGAPYAGPTSGRPIAPEDVDRLRTRMGSALRALPFSFEQLADAGVKSGMIPDGLSLAYAAETWASIRG